MRVESRSHIFFILSLFGVAFCWTADGLKAHTEGAASSASTGGGEEKAYLPCSIVFCRLCWSLPATCTWVPVQPAVQAMGTWIRGRGNGVGDGVKGAGTSTTRSAAWKISTRLAVAALLSTVAVAILGFALGDGSTTGKHSSPR